MLLENLIGSIAAAIAAVFGYLNHRRGGSVRETVDEQAAEIRRLNRQIKKLLEIIANGDNGGAK